MRLSSRRGFTLVELMISVLLFSIGVASLLAVMTQGVTVAKRADYAYVSENLAKNHLGRLRSLGFASITSALDETTGTRIDRDGDPDNAGDYQRFTTVTTSYASDANLTQVTIEVYYYFRGVLCPAPKKITTVLYNG